MDKEFGLFEMVKQRPNKKLKATKVKCPYCGSKKTKKQYSSTTLLGIDKYNHKWFYYQCLKCGREFTVEQKDKNVWITDKDDHVLDGMPSCFESYIYDCKCGGKVRRRCESTDGTPRGALSITRGENGIIRHYKTFWDCDKCGKTIETEQDHYTP